MRRTAFILRLLVTMSATPAAACSVTDDYRVPTNLELAADADLIVLARVESGPTDFNFQKAALVVTPIEVLKGSLPAVKPLTLMGMIAEPRFAVKSDPVQLEQAHPLSYIGGCIRYMFVKGSTVLFFVKPAAKAYGADVPAELKGTLVPAGGAFSRWAEDVPSVDAPWVRATKIYIRAALLPKNQQHAFLASQRDVLLKAPDPYSKLIGADVDRQLAGPNKPWKELMEEEIKRMEQREKQAPKAGRS